VTDLKSDPDSEVEWHSMIGPGRGVKMEALLGEQESVRSVDAITRKLVIDAKRSFEGVADDAFLEQCARDAVNEIWRDSIKVTTFVPVLAMRRVREIVSSRELPTAVAIGER
jgi:hypothetical protein